MAVFRFIDVHCTQNNVHKDCQRQKLLEELSTNSYNVVVIEAFVNAVLTRILVQSSCVFAFLFLSLAA